MRVIWNGALVEQSQSSCDEKGWMQGSGIFETIKTVDNKPWAMSRHMRRAVSGARIAGIRLPSEDSIRDSIDLLCNQERHRYGALRLSFGEDGSWSAAHLEYQPFKQSARILTHLTNIYSAGQQVKRFPYTERLNLIALAHQEGYDELILVGPDGTISEGAVTNLLFRLDDEWVTPPISAGVLPGIMRALVIEYCGVRVKSIHKDDLSRVKSAFLLSSLRLAQPVASIDDRELIQSSEFRDEIEAMALRTSVG